MPHELDCSAALDRVVQLMAIPGPSGSEAEVAEALLAPLRSAGVEPSWVARDEAHTRSRLGGNCGNLIVRIPGTADGPTTLLTAHMDTVPLCVGCRPEVDGDVVRSANPATGLGADNRAGCAVVLTAALELLRSGEPRGPLTLCWFVQEEIGLEGSRHLDRELLGPVDQAVNFDGGAVEKLTVGATGGERMSILVTGVPAHAGVAPQDGTSAITIAARAIARLHEQGWLGRVERAEGSGTANVGVIEGGAATNVVTPEVRLRAEARSHDPQMRGRIVQAIRDAFAWAAADTSNAAGRGGTVDIQSHVDYESFRLPDEAAVVRRAREAVAAVGRTPRLEVSNGGLDANWLFHHGLPAVTLGCGQRHIHTTEEQLVIADYLDACRTALHLLRTSCNAR